MPHATTDAKAMPASAGTGAEPSDLDGHWKDALEHYVEPCLRLFWPALHAHMDWTARPVFRDKELQRLAGASRRGRRYVDKLVELRLRTGVKALLLIHIEVQARLDAAFLSRMYTYHYRLRDRHPEQDIVHLGILTRSRAGPSRLAYRLAPLGGGFGYLEFVFPVVHLAGWRTRREALRDLARDNPFAVMVLVELDASDTLARAPRARLQRKVALMRLLYDYGYGEADVQRLFRFIDGVLALPAPESLAFTEAVARLEGEFDVSYVTSVERVGIEKGLAIGRAKGREEGREEGRTAGLRQALTELLVRRFGPLPDAAAARVSAASAAELQRALGRVLEADTLEQVLSR
ncbi:hypothetical protein FOZ76_13885 [Verticiella sediminum]|uniref:DUF4351 domain-containing protein n=1 Tax=Verticiella sediminum TaxID=1247510 RepID=A0A556AKC4_9BURK|nr:hypothetical protein [Verticiella sediminum]TSH93354.1 hypothetical protein FOZ76_13885 [Verticiella sediminum]